MFSGARVTLDLNKPTCVISFSNLIYSLYLDGMEIVIRPRGYKTFFILNSAEHEFNLLINVKIVGILTFVCMINTTSERHKASRYFSVYEQLKFSAKFS